MKNKEVKKLFDSSSIRHFKVFHAFKKIVLANVTNEEDVDIVKLYLFQVAESSLYDYDPIEFISEIDCFEFVEKYDGDLIDINTLDLVENKIDVLNGSFYDLCKSCYKAFCTDLLTQSEL